MTDFDCHTPAGWLSRSVAVRALHGRDADREALTAIATDPSKTIRDLHAAFVARGVPISRAAAGRWRLMIMPRRAGRLSRDRQRMIRSVMSMTREELRDAVERLPSRFLAEDFV